MTVLIVERLPARARGEITRWMLEVGDGVYVNRLSATVRDRLWEMFLKAARPRTAAVLIYASPADQGFTIHSHGRPGHEIVDFEGLALVKTKQ